MTPSLHDIQQQLREELLLEDKSLIDHKEKYFGLFDRMIQSKPSVAQDPYFVQHLKDNLRYHLITQYEAAPRPVWRHKLLLYGAPSVVLSAFLIVATLSPRWLAAPHTAQLSGTQSEGASPSVARYGTQENSSAHGHKKSSSLLSDEFRQNTDSSPLNDYDSSRGGGEAFESDMSVSNASGGEVFSSSLTQSSQDIALKATFSSGEEEALSGAQQNSSNSLDNSSVSNFPETTLTSYGSHHRTTTYRIVGSGQAKTISGTFSLGDCLLNVSFKKSLSMSGDSSQELVLWSSSSGSVSAIIKDFVVDKLIWTENICEKDKK